MSQIKAVIFDFDGTLYDSSKFGLHLVLMNIFSMFKIKAERNIRNSLKNKQFKSKDELFDEFSSLMSKKCSIKKDDFNDWYNQTYQDMMIDVLKSHYKLRDKTDLIFEYLIKNNIPYVFLSDYPRVEEKLKVLNFKKEFIENCKAFITSSDYGSFKPMEASFNETLRILNVSPEECLMVGDSFSSDIQGAINVNMNYIQIVKDKDKRKINKDYQMTYNDFAERLILGEILK